MPRGEHPGEGLGNSSSSPHESRGGDLGTPGGRVSSGLLWKELLAEPWCRKAAGRALRLTPLPGVLEGLRQGSGGAGTRTYHSLCEAMSEDRDWGVPDRFGAGVGASCTFKARPKEPR